MKKLWSLVSKTVILAFVILLSVPAVSVSQGVVSPGQKTVKHHSKKTSKKRRVRVINNRSDDDKKLKEIKDRKNKEKAGK